MRHADAASPPGTPDHDRPLTEQGRDDARSIGRWLRSIADDIAVVRCSTARRVRETWHLVAAELPEPPEAAYEAAIYRAVGADLLELVREHADAAGTVVLVGHNPAVHEAANALADEPLPQFPAGAAAVFDVTDHTTRRVDFAVP